MDFDKMVQGFYGSGDYERATGARSNMAELEKECYRDGFDPLAENLSDVIRRVAYIADRVSSGQNVRDYYEKIIHDTGYLVERRDAVVLNILREIERSLCMGKGHSLIQWPNFEEMLKEQKK